MADYGYDAPYGCFYLRPVVFISFRHSPVKDNHLLGELCCYYESFHWCQNINPDDLYGTRLFELDING